MMINISIRIEDGRAILNDLNYYGANLIDDKAFVQIAEITGQTLDAYTAMIDDGILAANKGEMPKQDLTQALNALQPEAVKQAPVAPEPKPEPAKEEKPVTVEEVRKALIEVKKTKPEALKVCFDAVGTKSLSATDPAQYGALLAKAQEVLHA